MAVTTSARPARWLVPLAGAVLVAACTGSTPAPTAATTSPTGTTPAATTTVPAATTTTATTPGAGPLSTEDLAFLQGVDALANRLTKAVTDAPSNMNEATLRSLADQLRTCTPELADLGAPTDQLKPVDDLVKQACAKYDEAAACFDKAAGIRLGGSVADVRKQLGCATSATVTAGKLLADAGVKGIDLQAVSP